MTRLLISSATALFIFGTSFAHEAIESPTVPLPGANVVAEDRGTQFPSLAPEGTVPCTTIYTPTHDNMGWYIREAVDCEE